MDISIVVKNRSLYSRNIFIDFDGEKQLKWISTDFLRMFENVFAVSPWNEVIRLLGCKVNPHNRMK